jgi:diguanylate cyclase (GGDEF)-like protein
LQKDILLKQAQTHFQDQVNNRAWIAGHGGVYVRPKNGLKPNPYLKDNILIDANGEKLVKINPSWMTRQLSEIEDMNGFHFRITSLNPINPTNKPNKFEKRALEILEKDSLSEYYDLSDPKYFRYVGALKTTKNCLQCHSYQGYKVGDVRGGISIELDRAEYDEVVEFIDQRVFYLRTILTVLLFSVLYLLLKQLKNNEKLQEEVKKRTQEILSTKTLLQEVIDTDLSFLMVAHDKEIILANKTMLAFFECSSLDSFLQKYKDISKFFQTKEAEDLLTSHIDGQHWIEYLLDTDNYENIKIMMIKDNEKRYFRPHVKTLEKEDQILNIIIFDEITKELEKTKKLEEKASKDALTGLFNRGKFDDVLTKEIALSETLDEPLSVVFLDIDHFKIVNDTYGHDAGDTVLKEIATILRSTVRKGDFVARWGGEEFVITLQSAPLEDALELAEKIRSKVESFTFSAGGKQTVSLGVTQHIYGESIDTFMKRVDSALYEAKEGGRNKVISK